MNTNDLKIFEILALTNSFTRTADQMNTVQSNVTARIRSLEETYKTTLFIRDAKKVSLTPAGERLLPYAKKIDLLLNQAADALSNSDNICGKLAIGSTESTAAIRLPAIIARFSKQYPEIDIQLTTSTTGELINEVLSYKLDGAFVAAPVAEKNLSQETICSEELVIASGKQFRHIEDILQNKDGIKVIIFKKGCFFRFRLETYLGNHGIRNFSIMEINSLEGIMNCVKEGIGITMLPKAVVDAYNSKKMMHIHPLPKHIASVTTLFVNRNDLPVSLPLKLFKECIHSSY